MQGSPKPYATSRPRAREHAVDEGKRTESLALPLFSAFHFAIDMQTGHDLRDFRPRGRADHAMTAEAEDLDQPRLRVSRIQRDERL